MDTATLIASIVGILLALALGAGVMWVLRPRNGGSQEEIRRLGREVVRLEEAVRTLHATTTNLHDRVLVMETRAACESHGPNQMTVDSNACNISVRAGPGGTPIGVSVSEPSPAPDFPPDFAGGE